MPTHPSESYHSHVPLETRDKNTYSSRIPPESVGGPDLPLLPVIDSLEPATLSVDAPDTPMEVVGRNFTEESVIVWNGGDEPTTFNDSEHLSTIVKPSTVQAPLPFALPVQVRNGETVSLPATFTFTAPPEPEEGETD